MSVQVARGVATPLDRVAEAEGYTSLRLLVFSLPSEWRGASVKLKEEKSKKKYSVSIALQRDPRKIQNMRRTFYRIIKKIAWPSPLGWVLFRDVNFEDGYYTKIWGDLNGILTAYREEFGDNVKLYVVNIYAPKEKIHNWIRENIAEIKSKIQYVKEKLTSEKEQKKIARLARELRELNALLKTMMNEAKLVAVG